MASFDIFHVDAYTDRTFGGNPAAVIPLGSEWLPDEVLQSIARENNLSETAFLVGVDGAYAIRWFNPKREVDLCGHATLASAFVIARYLEPDRAAEGTRIAFDSPRSGELPVTVTGGDGTTIVLELPADPVQRCQVPVGAARAVGSIPVAAYQGSANLLFLMERYEAIERLTPDFRIISQFPARGLIVTAAPGAAPEGASGGPDFGSRYFAPQAGMAEDPVTASAHATLAPFWAERLGKHELTAHQVSSRRGVLECRVDGDRVRIGGRATLYMKGRIDIDTV
jgi:PhzF family phenazine biosynthesis protein